MKKSSILKRYLSVALVLITIFVSIPLTVFAEENKIKSSVVAGAVELGTVKNLKAKTTTNSVTLTWSKLENASGYRVFRKVNDSWKTVTSDTKQTSASVVGFDPGTTHTFAVRAYSVVNGEKVWAKKYATITTATLPQVPASIKATAQTTTTVSLSWPASKGATGYRVFSYNSSTKKYEQVVKATRATKATIKNLTPGKTYLFVVRAYYNNGSDIFWSPGFPKVQTTTLPSKVTGVKVNYDSSTSAKVSWKKVNFATGYYVYSYDTSTKKYTKVGSTTGTSLTVKNMNLYKNNYFTVKAYKKLNGKAYWGEKSSLASLAAILTNTDAAYYYNRACNVAFTWYDVGNASFKYTDMNDVKYVYVNHGDALCRYNYYAIKHDSIKNMDDFKAYLNKYFSKKSVEYTLNTDLYDSENLRLYKEIGGRLYVCECLVGDVFPFIQLDYTKAQLYSVKPDKITYKITYRENGEFYGEGIKYISEYVSFVLENGRWVISEEKKWGTGLYQPYEWDGHSPK